MSADPILILQMQRMGDLILTFPLIIDIMHAYPGHPVTVAAEPCFFEPLLDLAPRVTFVPPSALADLTAGTHYRLAVNLITRTDALSTMAELARHGAADETLGPVPEDGSLHVHGFWHLYRQSLTHNNCHNTFHWADLYRMDAEEVKSQVSAEMVSEDLRVGKASELVRKEADVTVG